MKLLITLSIFIILGGCKSSTKKVQYEEEKATVSENSIKSGETKKNSTVSSCEKLYIDKGHCFVPSSEKIYNIPIGKSPFKGPKDAPVTIVEFTDFQCPACQNFTNERIPKLLKQYKGKIRVVFKYFPLSFHKFASTASQVAEEVKLQKGEKAFWKFHDLIFSAGDKLNSESFIVDTAVSVGCDRNKVQNALKKGIHKGAIKKDIDLGSKVGVEGTPWIFINGRLAREKPAEVLVSEAISEAEKAIADGTPKSRIYSFLVDHGSLVYNKPIPKEIYKQRLKEFKTGFISKCEKKDPSYQKFYQSVKICAKSETNCKPFLDCIEKTVLKP